MFKKVAIIGSIGSGKTTIVESLSSTDTLNTDVESSVDIGKAMTTVGIDYGHIDIDGKTSLGIYGVPGQRRFSYTWDFVKQGLWAIVILIKNNEPESINELDYLIDYFEINNLTRCVIGITHCDKSSNNNTMKLVKKKLNEHKLSMPIYSIDPRQKSSALLIIETIISLDENM